MQPLLKAITEGSFLLDVKARDFPSLLSRAMDEMVACRRLTEEQRQVVEEALLERERKMSSAIGHGVSAPHVYLDMLTEPQILLVRLARPINLGAPDGTPTRFVFLLLGPTGATVTHLDTLASIARLMLNDEFRFDIRRAKSKGDLLAAVERFVKRTTPRPPEEETEAVEPLRFSGRLFGGLMADLRRRLPQYASDFRDGLNLKCLGSVLFLYFACLAPAVTFGGVMAAQTEGQIGAVEMLTATAACGVAFALLGGQPLIILAGTGPMLIYTAILYQLCRDLEIDFLPAYAWVGFWTAAILLLMAATDASCLARFFTRFTDEIFAALISLIFIYEAVTALVRVFHGLDVNRHHDTALLTLLLALGTLYVATSLSAFRRSRYLLPQMREFLADFGPTIALAVMTLAALWLGEVNLDILPVPDHFQTTTGRPWIVDPLAAPQWIWFASVGPAMLAVMLIFINQNITTRLVESSRHKLKKGSAYHLNLGVVGLLVGGCSVFGFPWLVGSIVPSLNHVRSLAVVEQVVGRNDDQQDRIIYVHENRISGMSIHILMGLSLLLLPWLKVVPMAVLYGLFLFMGIVSMKGNQFLERLSLWPMDRMLYPATHYIRRVPNSTIHKYTFLQFVCLVVLWIVKSSAVAILFPLLIVLLVPVRWIAGRFFATQDLAILDADGSVSDELQI